MRRLRDGGGHRRSPSVTSAPVTDRPRPSVSGMKTDRPDDVFASPTMDQRAYLQELLVDATVESIREQHDMLVQQRDKAAKALQQNVYGNYREFIKSSMDIGELEGEVAALRMRQHVFAATLQDLSRQAGVAARGDKNQKSAAAQDTWASAAPLVDNLAAFDAPDRALIRFEESTELAPDSFEVLQQVCLLVCTDCVIIATARKLKADRRRSAMPSPASATQRYAAERCLPLKEMAVINIKDSESARNAFKVLCAPDALVFRMPTHVSKTSLLADIASATASLEIAAKHRAAEEAQREAMARGLDALVAFHRAALTPQEAALQRIAAAMDDVEVLIAMRQFDEATEAILEARRQVIEVGTGPRETAMLGELDAQTELLAQAIAREISWPTVTRSEFVVHVKQLVALGLHEKAREVFLTSRSERYHARVADLKLEGEAATYVAKLTALFVSLIRSTAEWYCSVFPDPSMMSALVRWAAAELEAFAAVIVQVQLTDLRETGIDFGYLLENSFRSDTHDAVIAYGKRLDGMLARTLSAERWIVIGTQRMPPNINPTETELRVYAARWQLTESALRLHELSHRLIEETGILRHIRSVPRALVSVLCSLQRRVLDGHIAAAKAGRLDPPAAAAAMSNMLYFCHCLPRLLMSHARTVFEKPIVELAALADMIAPASDALRGAVSRLLDAEGTFECWGLADLSYAKQRDFRSDDDVNMPSAGARRLVRRLADTAACLPADIAASSAVLAAVVEGILSTIGANTAPLLSPVGLHRFCLDAYYIRAALAQLTSDEVLAPIDELIKSAIQETALPATMTLKPTAWFNERAKEALSELSPLFSGAPPLLYEDEAEAPPRTTAPATAPSKSSRSTAAAKANTVTAHTQAPAKTSEAASEAEAPKAAPPATETERARRSRAPPVDVDLDDDEAREERRKERRARREAAAAAAERDAASRY